MRYTPDCELGIALLREARESMYVTDDTPEYERDLMRRIDRYFAPSPPRGSGNWDAHADIYTEVLMDRFQWLATFKPNQLHLTRNDHARNYCTAKQWIEATQDWFKDESPEAIQAMIDADTIWTLQIYPDTPVGFYRWNRATLGEVIDAAMAHFNASDGDSHT